MPKFFQLPVFLPTWKNLARILLTNDSDDWRHISEILRSVTEEIDNRVYKLVAIVFDLVNPAGKKI